MNDLPDLLARWTEIAPDECEIANANDRPPTYAVLTDGCLFGKVYTDGDSNSYAHVLGAVVYHAGERGLCLGMETGPFDSGWSADARAWPPERHASRALPYVSEPVGAGDGDSALRALATATLRAYLSALTTP